MSHANDNGRESEDEPTVFIIIGRASRRKGGRMEPVHVMLAAPDDDSAVRMALEALASERYSEADLDQIGVMNGEPDEEPHASAWSGVLAGEIAVIDFS